MNRWTGWLLTAMLVVPAARAEMIFTPKEASLRLAAGESGRFTYNVTETEHGLFNSMAPLWDLADSSIDLSWLSANVPIRGYMMDDEVDVEVTVTVPDDTPLGRYSGMIRGRTGFAKGNVEVDGVMLVVDVVDVVARCDQPARFVADNTESLELWVPNRSLHGVELFGSLELGDGCTLIDARYEVVDEYGEHDATGTLTVDPVTGAWQATPMVEASRRGQDRDGRHYTVTLTVVTEAGESRLVRQIVVPHDQRPDR